MSVRNFWIDASVDGRKTELSGGPRSKDGGMYVEVQMRDNGAILSPLRIYCRPLADGVLELEVQMDMGDGTTTTLMRETKR